MLESFRQGREFDEFQYRLVYMKPTPYSEERLVVGLVADSQNGRLESRFITSVASMELMTRLLGEEGVEQFHFAAAELRRAVASAPDLDSLSMPIDLLTAGEKVAAFTLDRSGLLASVLASGSCLMRPSTAKSVEPLNSNASIPFTKDLFDHVNRLSPLTAGRILNQRVTVDTGQVVELPILGRRIFGAPVSFAARDQRMKAEAYVAKFHWLSDLLPQDPRVYLLAPEERADFERADLGMSELRAIADALRVPLKIADSTEQLATLILQDEAA